MMLWREFRAGVALLLTSALACPPARALVALNDGHDRIYVSGSVGVAHDSNVFASADSAGDYVYSTSIAADYTRRAGWIGVNGSVGVTSSKFATIDGQDFANPNLSLEFTKQSGRTTGSITLGAARQSRADAAVNLRTNSWNYNAGVAFRYPVSGAFSVAGNLGYASTVYTDSTIFSDLRTYHAAVDLFHIFTSDRDLIGGYRYRHGDTSRSTSFSDHALTAGVTGKIIRGINGSLRVGYQMRVPHGGTANGERFSSWTASGAATYAINKRMNVTGTLAKDFSTTATDSFVDTLTASLDTQYAYSSKWSASAGVTVGDTEFLGDNGRVLISLGPPLLLGPQRHDTYLTGNASLNYSMNEHLKVSLAYTWFKNWSTLAFADFERNAYSLNVSTRW